MKNIHVLPTDKPTGIWKLGDNLHFSIMDKVRTDGTGFHLYITSNEEIKEGDWFIHSSHGITNIYKAKSVVKESIITTDDNGCWIQYCQKIILTDNKSLIKDGVQTIDDDFLEWFVKNPSFKGVEVIYGLYNPSGRKVNFEILNQNHSQCVWKYKIIIPNEEPKCQHPTRLREYYHKNAFKCFECNKIITSTDIINPKSNKETLEEVKVPIGEFIINNAVSIQGADGAYYHYSEVCKLLKLQSQRMCSEEDMIKFALFLEIHLPMKPRKTHHQLLEQFKTK